MHCNIDKNKVNCNCTYPCSRKGICCECINSHRKKGQLPACYFNKDYEKSYDRSIDNFIDMYQKHGFKP